MSIGVFDHFLETSDFGWSDVLVFEKINYEQFGRIVEKTFEQIADHALLRLLAINQGAVDECAPLLLVLDISLLLQYPHHCQNRAVGQPRIRQRFDDFRNRRLPFVPEHVHQLKLDFGQRRRFPASHCPLLLAQSAASDSTNDSLAAMNLICELLKNS